MDKVFGKLEKVDLRKLWYGEASEFTPWLSKEENIAYLGEAIGLELEVQEQEHRVGLFRADILCKDVINDHFVLIENQLERTDHTHLGQLMTYAAGLDAVTIIWIARSFAEEHRAALDWLNNKTDESINFFGIEIEAFRIGDSLPAPKFNIVAKPNDWTKQVRMTTSQVVSEMRLLQQEYWTGLKKYLEEKGSFIKLRNPMPSGYSDISIGRSEYYLSATLNNKDKSINIWLNIMGKSAKDNYDRLYSTSYENSLKEIDEFLKWDRMEGKKMSAVLLKSKADFTKKDDWLNQFAWFKEKLEKFERFFRPKVKNL